MDHRLIAVIVQGLSLASWQAKALVALGDSSRFLLLNCTNIRPRRKGLRASLYSILERSASRSPAARQVTNPGLDIEDIVHFEAEQDGAWHRLPSHVLDRLNDSHAFAVVNFGVKPLRFSGQLNCPVLSYSHGDPRRDCGNSVGFYEMLHGVGAVGQVIEVLTESTEGAVVAFAETRVRPYSYRATVDDVYRSSALLLKDALRNYTAGKRLPFERSAKAFGRPSNLLVARFIGNLVLAKIRAAARVIFLKANWEVARAELCGEPPDALSSFPVESMWRVYPCPPEYQFLADPFPHPSSGILVEALRATDERGEILHFVDGIPRTLCTSGGHFSYPGTISYRGEHFLVPETALWSSPMIYRLNEKGAEAVGSLKLGEDVRLIDPTLYENDEHIYLFANHLSEMPNVLRLWVGTDLFSTFREHPYSPIRLSPAGSRMGGAIFSSNGRLYRVGQESRRQYGNGIILFEITTISPHSYEERRVGALSFTNLKGPHTLNFIDGDALFDFYRVELSVLRGIRKLLKRATLPFSRRLNW